MKGTELRKLLVALGVDAEELRRGMDDADQKVTRSTSKMKQTIGDFSRAVAHDLGSASAPMGALAGGITAIVSGSGGAEALAQALRVTAGAAMEFGAGMGNVATLLPGQSKRVEELSFVVRQLAIDVGKGTSDITGGLYQTLSAFGNTADTAKILEINVRGAAAGLATTTEAINLTSAVTKGYGDTSAEAVQHVADLAFQTVRLGQTTFPELAASIGKTTPLAASLGVSVEQLFGVFATFTGVTGGAAEVSTQLRGVFQSLLAPTDSMQALIEKLGFKSAGAMVQALGLQGTINAIVKAAGESHKPLQDYISSIEGQTIALSAAGGQADTFKQKTGEMLQVAGAATQAFKDQTEGLGAANFQWERFKAIVGDVAISIGNVLLPPLIKTLEVLNQVIQGLQNLPRGDSEALGAALNPFSLLEAEQKASGGPLSRPGFYIGGEDGREIVVPTNAKHHAEGVSWWQQAGHELGIPGFAGGGIAGSRGMIGQPTAADRAAVAERERMAALDRLVASLGLGSLGSNVVPGGAQSTGFEGLLAILSGAASGAGSMARGAAGGVGAEGALSDVLAGLGDLGGVLRDVFTDAGDLDKGFEDLMANIGDAGAGGEFEHWLAEASQTAQGADADFGDLAASAGDLRAELSATYGDMDNFRKPVKALGENMEGINQTLLQSSFQVETRFSSVAEACDALVGTFDIGGDTIDSLFPKLQGFGAVWEEQQKMMQFQLNSAGAFMGANMIGALQNFKTHQDDLMHFGMIVEGLVSGISPAQQAFNDLMASMAPVPPSMGMLGALLDAQTVPLANLGQASNLAAGGLVDLASLALSSQPSSAASAALSQLEEQIRMGGASDGGLSDLDKAMRWAQAGGLASEQAGWMGGSTHSILEDMGRPTSDPRWAAAALQGQPRQLPPGTFGGQGGSPYSVVVQLDRRTLAVAMQPEMVRQQNNNLGYRR